MKPILLIFFIKRSLRDMVGNRFLHAVTIITIALSILIVSAFGLFLQNAGYMINSWNNGIRLMAYLRPDVANSGLARIKETIAGMDGVSEVSFVSKDEGLKHLKAQMKNQKAIFENLRENPLPDLFEIRMAPSIRNWEKVEVLASMIKTLPDIDDVEYGKQWVGRINSVFNLFRLAGTAMSCVFFMASVFIVANTIRLLFYSRREEFEIMRLVGATDGFIKTPFYIEGIIQGMVGGIIGIFILYLAYVVITSNIEQGLTSTFFHIRFISLKFSFGIIICSMFAGWFGCYLSFKQFLNT